MPPYADAWNTLCPLYLFNEPAIVIPPLPNICPTATTTTLTADSNSAWYANENLSVPSGTETNTKRTFTIDFSKWLRADGTAISGTLNQFLFLTSVKRNTTQYYLIGTASAPNNLIVTIFDRSNCQQILPTSSDIQLEGGLGVTALTTNYPFARKTFGVTQKQETWITANQGHLYVAVRRTNGSLGIKRLTNTSSTDFDIAYRYYDPATQAYLYTNVIQVGVPSTWVNEGVTFTPQLAPPANTNFGFSLAGAVPAPTFAASARTMNFSIGGSILWSRRLEYINSSTLDANAISRRLASRLTSASFVSSYDRMHGYLESPLDMAEGTDVPPITYVNEVLSGFFVSNSANVVSSSRPFYTTGLNITTDTTLQAESHRIGYIVDRDPNGNILFQTEDYHVAVLRPGSSRPKKLNNGTLDPFPRFGQALMTTFEYDSDVSGFIGYGYNGSSSTTFVENVVKIL
jgi:hypothetical protein